MKTSDTLWITITIFSCIWLTPLQCSNELSVEKLNNEMEKLILKHLNSTERACNFPVGTTIALNNQFFHVDADTMWLTDLLLRTNFSFNDIGFYPDLRLMNMNISGNIGTVQVDGSYEFFSNKPTNFYDLIPVLNTGKFSMVVNNLTAKGISGITFKHNSVLVHSLDLAYQYDKNNTDVTFKFFNGSTQQVNNKTTKSLMDHLEFKMTRVLDSLLKHNINTILHTVNINNVFFNDSSSRTFHSIIQNTTTEINELVDQVLYNVRQLITEWGMTRIAAPNITEKFSRKIGFITLTGEFKASKGWLESIDTLRRTNDFYFSTNEHDFFLEGEIGLDKAQISYDHYEVKFMGIGLHGSLTANIDENSIHFKLRVSFTGKNCVMSFLSLELKDLKLSDVYITGLGPLDWLASKIVTWISNSLRYTMLSVINGMLPGAADQAARNLECKNVLSQL